MTSFTVLVEGVGGFVGWTQPPREAAGGIKGTQRCDYRQVTSQSCGFFLCKKGPVPASP